MGRFSSPEVERNLVNLMVPPATIRTRDPLLTGQLLYRLSYEGKNSIRLRSHAMPAG